MGAMWLLLKIINPIWIHWPEKNRDQKQMCGKMSPSRLGMQAIDYWLSDPPFGTFAL